MRKKMIYLDNAATTPVYKDVVREMEKFYLEDYGNPSSLHKLGERAFEAINNSRKFIAQEINCKPWEIIFTSGTTESNNLAFFGLARGELGKKKKRIIISAIEHSSIFLICEVLRKEGFEIIQIPVDNEGIVNIDYLNNEVNDNTLLVSVMHVNNEVGTIENIFEIGEICRKKGVLFHSDCAQSFGKLDVDVNKMKIDLLSAGAHKIGGPKGIGFLYVREVLSLEPLIYGGGQERNLRGGTEDVPAIVGFAKALGIIKKVDNDKILKIRDYFISSLEKVGGKINGSKKRRIFNNINVSFNCADAENFVIFLSEKGIMCSSGSACESKKQIESRVLKAIGLNEKERMGSVRFSLNENIAKRDINYVIGEIKKALYILRR